MPDYYNRLARMNQGSRFARGHMGEGPPPQQQELSRRQVVEGPSAMGQSSSQSTSTSGAGTSQLNNFDILNQRSSVLESMRSPDTPISEMDGPYRAYSRRAQQQNQLQLQNVEGPKHFASMVNRISQDVGVRPELINAIIKQESNFNMRAKSHAGAAGLMQLMPGTARSLGVKNPYDATQNVRGGATYIKQMLNKYPDARLALAAYNWGPGNVDKALKKYGNSFEAIERHLPKETRNYVPSVLKNMGL